MDLLNGKIRPQYFKYLSAAFGSALISSIYSAADMAMVGQYQGPDGTAALAVIGPVWNIIYSLGLLMDWLDGGLLEDIKPILKRLCELHDAAVDASIARCRRTEQHRIRRNRRMYSQHTNTSVCFPARKSDKAPRLSVVFASDLR